MTPNELAKETEHSHQRALFAWLNMAARYGYDAANNERAYSAIGRDEIPQNVKLQWRSVPELAYAYAIHNQGHGDRVRGGKAKAEGVKAGVPDICLPVPRPCKLGGNYFGLYLELKRPSHRPVRGGKGGVSDAQLEYMSFLTEQGYACAVAYGWRDAANIIHQYMDGKL